MAADEAWPVNPFWDFSIAVYGRTGVAQACLTLQERHGIDVNLLLFCAWIGASSARPMGEGELDAAVAAVAAWHDGMVRPLRRLRSDLKIDPLGAPPAQAERLRAQIKSAELNAERIEQAMLYRRSQQAEEGTDDPGEAARHNMRAYLFRAGVVPGEGDLDALAAIAEAAILGAKRTFE